MFLEPEQHVQRSCGGKVKDQVAGTQEEGDLERRLRVKVGVGDTLGAPWMGFVQEGLT